MVRPEVRRITVFNSGRDNLSTIGVPREGHIDPISSEGTKA